jgi:DNA-binding transcriptional LysR family regulator
MPDRRLQTFLTLYDTMSYHETARLLHLTQPAVTQQIHALEAEYGKKLFSYDHRSLSRTEAADTLALWGRSLARGERLLREAMAAAAREPLLRVGATKTIGDYVLPAAAARYLLDPAHRLSVTVDNTAGLLALLEQDELDFALVEGDFDRARYGSRLLRMEPFAGVCARESPLAGKTVPLADLFGQTLLLREPGSGTRAVLERRLAEEGCAPAQFSRVVCLNSFGLICRLAEAGAGISFVYRAVADGWPGLARFALDGPPLQHPFTAVFLRGCGAEAAVERFYGEAGPMGQKQS